MKMSPLQITNQVHTSIKNFTKRVQGGFDFYEIENISVMIVSIAKINGITIVTISPDAFALMDMYLLQNNFYLVGHTEGWNVWN